MYQKLFFRLSLPFSHELGAVLNFVFSSRPFQFIVCYILILYYVETLVLQFLRCPVVSP
jgi:hypothetical protein